MIELTGQDLTIEQIAAVARGGETVAPLSEEVCRRLQRTHDWVRRSITQPGKVIYGVNTGFGSLASKVISASQARKLSRNLIVMCVSSVGKALPEDVVRAMMLIRANMLAKGHSGVRPVVAETLINMLNAGITPLVPEKGSLGASGDLAPLAHIATVMTRDLEEGDGGYSGKATYQGELVDGDLAMQRAGIPRLVLEAKEGLALSNGMDFMTACAALAVYDSENLLRHAQVAAALSLEALLALSAAYEPALHAVSNQPGQQRIAANLRQILQGSSLIDSLPEKVQDAYSLRCIPQVLGPVLDTVAYVRQRISAAINAATDNPLIFPLDGEEDDFLSISGGNFHGQGPAMWLDFLGIAMAEVANIAERRIFRLLTPELNFGLPAMLVPTSGLDGGLMMVQYTAAALVSDNKTLAHPDSVDSIPSCANQEDHVSMGANAARHTLEILENVRYVVAIELQTAAQAIDLRTQDPANQLGRGTSSAYEIVRQYATFLEHDRETSGDTETLSALIQRQEIIAPISELIALA